MLAVLHQLRGVKACLWGAVGELLLVQVNPFVGEDLFHLVMVTTLEEVLVHFLSLGLMQILHCYLLVVEPGMICRKTTWS